MSQLTIKFVPFTKLVTDVVSRELEQISNQKPTWWARRERCHLGRGGFLRPLNKSIADNGKRERSDSNYRTRFDQAGNDVFHTM
jgi:hypothetical protein